MFSKKLQTDTASEHLALEHLKLQHMRGSKSHIYIYFQIVPRN